MPLVHDAGGRSLHRGGTTGRPILCDAVYLRIREPAGADMKRQARLAQ